MSRHLEIITPEQVVVRYELAGFGSRAVAAGIDWCLVFLLHAAVFGILALLVWLKLLPAWGTFEQFYDMQKAIAIGLLILASFIIVWGYFILFELLWNGETPGKRLMKLRVIMEGGHPVDFHAVLVRNLLRAIDGLPLTYGVAFTAMLCHARYKRLGDHAAGTVVVYHGGPEPLSRHAGLGQVQQLRLLDASVLSHLSRLDREDYRSVQRYLERRSTLPAALRGEFARQLAQPFIDVFGCRVPTLGMDYNRWLEELDFAYRRHALGQPIQLADSVPVVPVTAPVDTTPSDIRKW